MTNKDSISASSSIKISDQVRKFLKKYHQLGRRITLVTGVFDLLHEEHIEFLKAAKQIGEVLIVAIESDQRVRELKGEGRPVFNQEQRLDHLLGLEIADQVFVLPEKFSSSADHEALIAAIKPRVLAVSAHSPYLDKKENILHKYGGEVRVVRPHNPAISTTILLKKRQDSKE